MLSKSYTIHSSQENCQHTQELLLYFQLTLTFLSKVQEEMTAKQLLSHTDINDLHEIMQSNYGQHHSTETALLGMQNDIIVSLDQKQLMCSSGGDRSIGSI